MLDLSLITKALATVLSADATVGGYLISRGEYVNDDPSLTPWVGIYKGSESISPLSLGANSSRWLDEPKLLIVVQASSMKSGANCEDKIELYKKAVLDVLNTNSTIGGTVQTITGYEIDYSYNRNERDSIYFQEALITISVRTKTGG